MVHSLPQLSRDQEMELSRRWYENGDSASKD